MLFQTFIFNLEEKLKVKILKMKLNSKREYHKNGPKPILHHLEKYKRGEQFWWENKLNHKQKNMTQCYIHCTTR